MASTTTITEIEPTVTLSATSSKRMTLDGKPTSFGDFRDDLNRDGFAVIRGAVPRDRAKAYSDKVYSYLEGFGLGYNRNDESTKLQSKLPVINEKGMIMGYGICHEQFVWDIRGEPGVVEAFEKVYDDEDLIVSFDVINTQLANRTDMPENKPWPHQDQDPTKHGFRCLQGLVNLNPSGLNDGGLIVCKGAHVASEEFHKVMADEPRIPAWTPEWYGFTENGLKWLEEQGFKWEKVCAEPGDLIVWDSRTPHYNVPTKTNEDRFAVYTCLMPVHDATQEDLIRKKEAFEKRLGTTHWPNAKHVAGSNVAMRNGKPDPANRDLPLEEPVLSERVFKLTGIPYIKAQA